MRPFDQEGASMFVYNRVGKAGSTSAEHMLQRHCLVVGLKKLDPRYMWGGGPAGARHRQALLEGDLHRLARVRDGRPCRVICSHFQFTPLPPTLRRVRYINVVREPSARWASLVNFYIQWPWLQNGKARRQELNVSACLRTHARGGGATRACTSARDSHMADYLLAAAEPDRPPFWERAMCDAQHAIRQYAYVGILDNATDWLGLLRIFVLNATLQRPLTMAERRLVPAASIAASLPFDAKSPRQQVARWAPTDAADARVLRQELACDARLFNEARASNERWRRRRGLAA